MLEVVPSLSALRENLATAPTQHASLRAHLALAEALRPHDPHEALTHAGAALTIARALGRESDIAVAQMSIGMSQIALGDRHQAFDHLETAYRAFITDDEQELALIAAMAIGEARYAEKSLSGALQWFGRALDISRTSDDAVGQASALREIASVHATYGDREKALGAYHEALRVVEARGDDNAVGMGLADIAAFHGSIGDYDEALEYFRRSEERFVRGHSIHLEVRTVVNIARTLLALDRYDEALRQAERALASYTMLDDRRGLAAVFDIIGQTYEKKGEVAPALEHHIQGLDVLATADDENAEAHALMTIGRLRHQMGDYHEALLPLEEALHIAEERGDRRLQSQVHERLSSTLKRIGNVERALHHHELFAAMREEVLAVERQEAIGDMQLRFDLESAKREITIMRMEKEKLQREAEQNAAEIASVTLNLGARDALLGDLLAIAEKIERVCGAPAKAYASELRRRLSSERQVDNSWQRLLEMLQKRHPGFLDALSTRCPQLTEMQRRICALTRLGMNAAEIGEIIDGGPRDGEEQYDRIQRARRNVETHRMRIKKRLGLPSGITLAAFLEGLSTTGVSATEQTAD